MQNHKKVIPCPLPLHWTFWDYVVGENNPIEDWYQILSDEAKNLFDGLLKNISKTENSLEWTGFRGFLKGKLKSERIWELGFIADGRQFRILGIFGDQRKRAILLIGCYHKGRNYTPPGALDTALKRAKNLREGKASVHERKINTDF